MSRDPTARRGADDLLEESERRFRAVLENVNAGVALIDADGRFTHFNRQFLTIFGLASDSDIRNVNDRDWSAWQVFDEEGRLLHVDEHPVRKAALTGRPVRGMLVEVQAPGAGARTWMLVSAEPLPDESGRPARIVCTYADITVRKRTELALRESEARFRSVLDDSRDVIYRVNVASGRFEYISPACESLVGYPPAEVEAMDAAAARALIHPDDLAGFEQAVQRLADTGAAQVEYRQRTRAGEYRWLSNHMSLVRDAAGRPVYRDGNIRDITEQKRLEGTLQQAISDLEHANQVKDEFLATLSHELRTPLNAILGWSDLLLRASLAGDAARKALESIRRNAQAQAALISDILDVSRIVTGKLRLDVRPVDVADVVKAACEAVQPAADAKGIAIGTSVEGRPALLADVERLQQIVWNLLSNSVKFTGHGGHVDVSVRPVDSQIEIEVRDDGAGIAEEFLPHVFERFRQADSSTTRRQAGLGLGLAIVRSLAELHGGTVSAWSAGPGHGATFTVRLPVRAVFERDAPEEDGAAKGSLADAVTEGSLDGLRIVVVDDEEDARALVRLVLERHGAVVTSCADARETLDALAGELPDLLVADIGMPGCDGYELLRRVRQLPSGRAQALPAIQGSRLTAQGSRLTAQGSRLRAQGSRLWACLAAELTVFGNLLG